MAKQTTNHFLFNIFAFGGGVWGGAALKAKEMVVGCCARGHERVLRRITTNVERTEKYKATTRSARAKINRFAIVSQSRFAQRSVFLHCSIK